MERGLTVAYLVWQMLNPLCIYSVLNFMIFADLTLLLLLMHLSTYHA